VNRNSLRDFLKKLAVLSVINPVANMLVKASDRNAKALTEVGKFKKIDVHMHISSDTLI
jgi:hypothetical protein